ncbi:MAG: ribonuclease HII [Ruminococcus sp.]|jgi:ribonuclease HII|nr:ribonuclease HII [Ruminococcus sp.]
MADFDLFDYDDAIRNDYPVLCGVDEAGRGPLAGDVYAAAVILPHDLRINGINDSKKLSEKKREFLYDIIVQKSISWCVATASVEEIDRLNILQATMLAMKRAISGLNSKSDIIIVDGNKAPDVDQNVVTLIKGDATSASIAAASILAKVSRDRYMRKLSETYPQYQFEKHKGYGTKLHTELLLKYGPSEIHRKTFLRKLYSGK